VLVLVIRKIKKGVFFYPVNTIKWVPLNGGMNSTIPLRGGVPFTAGRMPFFFKGYPETMNKYH